MIAERDDRPLTLAVFCYRKRYQEGRVAQVLIRNLDEETVASYRQKARIKGISLEQELRNLLEANKPLTPGERAAVARAMTSRYAEIQPSLTLADIREGLE